MTTWEYTIEYMYAQLDQPSEIEDKLNTLGAEGWELVAIWDGTRFVFKRPQV